jgi:hypothetical protein
MGFTNSSGYEILEGKKEQKRPHIFIATVLLLMPFL